MITREHRPTTEVAHANSPLVLVENLTKRFGDFTAVKSINFQGVSKVIGIQTA